MEDKEVSNIYTIPANYTDSGRLLGGMLEVRNTVEACLLLLIFGYPQLAWLNIPGMLKVTVMVVTLLPMGVFVLIGVGGDSLFQFVGHVIRFWCRRRILKLRKAGSRNAQKARKYHSAKTKKRS